MNLYERRDTEDLGEHYFRHVDAMTRERLHEKNHIAAELAWRDAEIERLRNALAFQIERLRQPPPLLLRQDALRLDAVIVNLLGRAGGEQQGRERNKAFHGDAWVW